MVHLWSLQAKARTLRRIIRVPRSRAGRLKIAGGRLEKRWVKALTSLRIRAGPSRTGKHTLTKRLRCINCLVNGRRKSVALQKISSSPATVWHQYLSSTTRIKDSRKSIWGASRQTLTRRTKSSTKVVWWSINNRCYCCLSPQTSSNSTKSIRKGKHHAARQLCRTQLTMVEAPSNASKRVLHLPLLAPYSSNRWLWRLMISVRLSGWHLRIITITLNA